MSQNRWLLPTLLAPVGPNKSSQDVSWGFSCAGTAGVLTRGRGDERKKASEEGGSD